MNHSKYKKLLQLSVYDEVSPEEHRALEQHLDTCNECRRELEELKQYHSVIIQHKPLEPSDALLSEARQDLRTALRLERSRRPFWSRFPPLTFDLALGQYKIALVGISTLVIGLLIGYFAFLPSEKPSEYIAEKTTFMEGETRITGLRFIDSDAGDGMVEFTFDAISPVHIKGSIDDERVQKVLSHALLNDRNPGVRLRSVSAFATQAEDLKTPDREVKAALILAVTSDENPGVRKEALRVLRSFPFDAEIKQAFLHVLMRDENSGLRIAAINSLDYALAEGPGADEDILRVLREKMQSDQNNYVRIRATTFLREVKQQ